MSNIISKLPSAFQNAHDTGDLLFFPSTIHKHVESGIEFEIRLCPALQNKPHLPTPHFNDHDHTRDISAETTTTATIKLGSDTYNQLIAHAHVNVKPDPFAPPYNQCLYVDEISDPDSDSDDDDGKFVVLLNKYSVVSLHFLLVTKEYQSQSSPLLPNELVQIYLLLQAARQAGHNFFAFYNCGDRSGASQPHKHIQFIPVDGNGPPIENLAKGVRLEIPDKPFSITQLPYANHIRRIPLLSPTAPREEIETTLSRAFFQLLDLVISTVRHDPAYPIGSPSYNVFMTLEHLHLIPRQKEEHVLIATGEKLSVNSLGFAGMLLVKSERELEAVRSEGVVSILEDVGVKSVYAEQVSEPHRMD